MEICFEKYEDLIGEELKGIDVEEFPRIGILHVEVEPRKIEVHSMVFNKYLVIRW